MRTRRIAGSLAAVALVSMTFAFTASAQMDTLKNTTPEQRASALTSIMQSKLALTADQTPKIATINLKYAQQMDPILKGSGGPMANMQAMRGIQAAKEGELRGVLSSDQYQQYQAMKDDLAQKLEQKLQEKAAGGGS